jgi:signal transduction histidine kinase
VADGQYLVTFSVWCWFAQLVGVRAPRRGSGGSAPLALSRDHKLLAVPRSRRPPGHGLRPGRAVFSAPARCCPMRRRLCQPRRRLAEAGQAVFDDAAPAAPGVVRASGEWLLPPLRAPVHRLGVLALRRRGAGLDAGSAIAGGLGTVARRGTRQVAERVRAARSETGSCAALASISHDVRTPLAVITSASSTLADPHLALDAAARDALVRTIEARARDVSGLVTNVLELMRLESAPLRLRRDWEDLADLTGAALARVQERLAGHPVEVSLPADLPPVQPMPAW